MAGYRLDVIVGAAGNTIMIFVTSIYDTYLYNNKEEVILRRAARIRAAREELEEVEPTPPLLAVAFKKSILNCIGSIVFCLCKSKLCEKWNLTLITQLMWCLFSRTFLFVVCQMQRLFLQRSRLQNQCGGERLPYVGLKLWTVCFFPFPFPAFFHFCVFGLPRPLSFFPFGESALLPISLSLSF